MNNKISSAYSIKSVQPLQYDQKIRIDWKIWLVTLECALQWSE